jgi:hypothetical protein
MSEQKAFTREICVRYPKAGQIEKKAVLNEFTTTTGYNRKYAIRTLNAAFQRATLLVNLRAVTLQPKNRPRKKSLPGSSLRFYAVSGCFSDTNAATYPAPHPRPDAFPLGKC